MSEREREKQMKVERDIQVKTKKLSFSKTVVCTDNITILHYNVNLSCLLHCLLFTSFRERLVGIKEGNCRSRNSRWWRHLSPECATVSAKNSLDIYKYEHSLRCLSSLAPGPQASFLAASGSIDSRSIKLTNNKEHPTHDTRAARIEWPDSDFRR